MFTRLLVAVSAATLCLALPQAASAAQPLQPVAAPQSLEGQAAHIQAWLAAASHWSADYTGLIDQRASRLGALVEGGDQVRTLLDAGNVTLACAASTTALKRQRRGLRNGVMTARHFPLLRGDAPHS